MGDGGRLYFPLDPVLMLAEYTLTAPEHGDSFADTEDGIKTGPALMWVKDQGTYLMTNASPRPEGDVLYAREEPQEAAPKLDGSHEDDWDTCRSICGGDDFAEYLRLDAPTMAGWRQAKADGFGWLVVEVMPDGETFAVMVAR